MLRAAWLVTLALLTSERAALAESPPSGWPGELYSYTRNVKLAVEETTPTQEQAVGAARPPQIVANLPMPVASTQPAPPLVVAP